MSKPGVALIFGVGVRRFPQRREQDHCQRGDKRHASDDQRVSNDVAILFLDVRIHELAFFAHESRKLSGTVTDCAMRAGITQSIDGK
jgi:hypothetical protein